MPGASRLSPLDQASDPGPFGQMSGVECGLLPPRLRSGTQ
jgi:hypothetical protein